MPENPADWTPEPERESYRQIAEELRALRTRPRPSPPEINERCAEMLRESMRTPSATASKGYVSAAKWFALAAEGEPFEFDWMPGAQWMVPDDGIEWWIDDA